MIKALFKVLLVFLAALSIYFPAFANSIPEDAATQPITVVSTPVIQPLPVDDKTPTLWLTGRVSLVGGQVSSSEQQFRYAAERQIPFMATEAEYQSRVSTGYFVRLESPFMDVHARRPYALASTVAFMTEMSEAYYSFGCGRLTVKDALRLSAERPSNGSVYSVHPSGMAVDLRVRDIGEACENWMNSYLLEKEAEGRVDATREYWKMVRGQKVPNPHFHLVVPLEPRGPNLMQIADNTSVGAP
jgi:hypothetical protein